MKVDSEKLTIPIYLNTKIVFDMLATMEDGFSEIRNVQISSELGRETSVSADIGAGNVFAWLNFGAGAKASPRIRRKRNVNGRGFFF